MQLVDSGDSEQILSLKVVGCDGHGKIGDEAKR